MNLHFFAAKDFSFISVIPTILVTMDDASWFSGSQRTIGLTWAGFAVGVSW